MIKSSAFIVSSCLALLLAVGMFSSPVRADDIPNDYGICTIQLPNSSEIWVENYETCMESCRLPNVSGCSWDRCGATEADCNGSGGNTN